MTGTYLAWGIASVVIAALAVLLGVVITRHPLGLLIDSRGRYSLTHTQLTLWTITILSLVAGVFVGRWVAGTAPLTFDIPGTVLGAMGIAIGSTVAATAQKTFNNKNSAAVAASAPIDGWRPRLSQIFLAEQGAYADQTVDLNKFQNFVITVAVLLAYISIAVSAMSHAGTPAKFTGLPDISGGLLVLLGVSHGGYLAGKIPTPADATATLNVQGRQTLAAALVPSSKTAAGGLWSPTVTYADGDNPPTQVTPGTAVVVTASQPFTLGVTALPNGTGGPAVNSSVASAQVAGGQWAAVVPTTSLPAVGGKLELQVRHDVDTLLGVQTGPYPVAQTIPVTNGSAPATGATAPTSSIKTA